MLFRSEKDLPAGLKFAIPMNNNDFLYASINKVVHTLIEAFILVFVVVYVFLQDLRSTIIPAIAIPVALIGTFFVLNLIGFSLNLITLSALVLAIAIVVDDAIVVVEAVHAKLDAGYKSSRKASIDAMNEIGGAIISITLVMMLVFIPVSFMPGTAGIFYQQFGITMAIAIGFSALNALTLSPALCAVFLKPHTDEHGKKRNFVKRFHHWFNVMYDAQLNKYKKGANFFIRHKVSSAVIVAASIAALVWLMAKTPTALVPNEDTGTFFVMVDMPPGTSQERTKETMDKVDAILANIPAIEYRNTILGYSFIAGQGPTYGAFIVRLKDWSERNSKTESVDAIIQQFYGMAGQLVKDGRVIAFAPPMITGYSATNGFELKMQDKTGGSIDDFFTVVQGFLGALNQQPEIQMAYTTFNPTFPQYRIDIDAAKAQQAGLSTTQIISALQGYFGSMYVSNFNRFGKIYRVMMQSAPEARVSPESLRNIKVRGNSGKMASLENFVT